MLIAAWLFLLPRLVAVDIPIGSITPASYGDWAASGNAFRLGPAGGRRLTELEIRDNVDDAVISSEQEGDSPTGTPDLARVHDRSALHLLSDRRW